MIDMNTKTIFIAAILAVTISAISVTYFNEVLDDQNSIQTSNNIFYVPTDMSEAFPNYNLKFVDATYGTTDIKKVKDEVAYTIRGTVISIGQPEPFSDAISHDDAFLAKAPQRVKVSIDIQIDQLQKAKTELKRGDVITITRTGLIIDDNLILDTEEQFKVGEDVIVHIAEDHSNIISKDLKYVKLGQYGKYTIQNGKAFNENYPEGRLISSALGETQ